MEMSQHCSRGAYNAQHNTDLAYRKKLDHVDQSMSQHNVVLKHETVTHAYNALFGEAVRKYNEKQKRKDRRIENYYKKVVADSRGHKGVQNDQGKRPVYETIVGIGNNDTFAPTALANRQLAEKVYKDYLKAFEDAYPNFHVIDAVIHMDEPEGGIHMHLAFIPWAEGYKRGIERQQSLSKACQNMGLDHITIDQSMRDLLAQVCLEHGIERLDMDNHEHHKPTPEYKREQAKLRKIRSEIKEREQYAEHLDKKIEDYQRSRDLCRAEAKTALDEYRSLRETVEDLKDQGVTLRELRDRCRSDLDELKAEKVALEHDVTELKKEKSALESIVESLRGIADKLKETVAKYAPNPILELAYMLRNGWEIQAEMWHTHMDLAAEELAYNMPSRLAESQRNAEEWLEEREDDPLRYDKDKVRDEWSI